MIDDPFLLELKTVVWSAIEIDVWILQSKQNCLRQKEKKGGFVYTNKNHFFLVTLALLLLIVFSKIDNIIFYDFVGYNFWNIF